MAYSKQTFVAGQTLTAANMNHIEQGIKDLDDGKQEKLVSGTSLKTVNGQSLLGSGNIAVEGDSVIINGATLGAKYAGLYGKKVSFLGDSITTFQGWLPDSTYKVWYPKSTGDVTTVDQTWWKMLVDTSGMTFHKNCAWSGSKVTGNSSSTTSAEAGCSTKRIQDLAKDGVAPDVIVVLIGTNDFGSGNCPVGSWEGKGIPSEGTIGTFSEAYALMVAKIIKAYPKAEVFLCTLLDASRSDYDDDDKGVSFPTAFVSGDSIVTLKDYNDKIRFIAEAFGVNVLDMHACGARHSNFDIYSIDSLHPNAAGMKLMASKALAEISAKSVYMHPLGIASDPVDVYYTVTYEYRDTNGNIVNGATTKRVLSGTTFTLSTSDAPSITGYTISTVSHTNVTVNSDITITFTYEPLANVTYYTVTYKYVDSEGNLIKADTTQNVAEGVTINAVTSSAPNIDGYKIASVSPSGAVTVNSNITITYTYTAHVEDWYVNVTSLSAFTGSTSSANYSFVYTHEDTIAAMIGKPINAFRMKVTTSGNMSYGKYSETAGTYTKLGTLNLTASDTLQVVNVNEFTLAEGENVWFYGSSEETAKFAYSGTTKGTEISSFKGLVRADNLAGNMDNPINKGNLGIDIGYVA